MKISGLFAAALAAVNLLAAKPVATSVTARQRYPWNGKVDIVVTFSGASNDVAKAACVFAATNSATKAALAMAHVTDAGTISGSGATWTRRYVWDAAADLGEVKIADVVLAAEATPLGVVQGCVQLWEGGPYWAECNVGATKPEEYGYYFWWGDTVGYAREGGNVEIGLLLRRDLGVEHGRAHGEQPVQWVLLPDLQQDHGPAPVGRLHRRDGQPRGEVRRGDGAPRRAVADADCRRV